jgi:hypothetical protein
MDAELAASGRPHDPRCAVLRDDAALCTCGRARDVLAAVETAARQAAQGTSRRVLGKFYYRLPETVRPLLGQPEESGLKQLLGHFVRWQRDEQALLAAAVRQGRRINPDTGWIEGDAGLSERQTQAYWLRIRGHTTLDIQRELTRTEDRYDRAKWIAVQTVYNLCSQARYRVLRAFGLPLTDEPSEEADEGA